MTISLKELAKLTDSKIKGESSLVLKSVASLSEATKGDISFVSNPKYKKQLDSTKASAVILSSKLADSYAGNALINDDPYLTFAKVVFAFHGGKSTSSSIHASAIISEKAQIADGVSIAANVVIDDNVKIGKGTSVGAGTYIAQNIQIGDDNIIYSNVSIYEDCIIGNRNILHSGVVIGADGFGFALQKDKRWYKILQVGNVVIGSDVEVGANTTIDRAALGSTVISDGVKLDNQIQVGHNVLIKEHAIIVGGTVLAGSTTIGKNCQIGGHCAIAGHLEIADNVMITGFSMVINSILEAGVYSSGIVSQENRKWRKNAARFRQLDDMAKTLKRVEQRVDKSFARNEDK